MKRPMKIERFEEPFFHIVIDDFLPDGVFEDIQDEFMKLKFNEIQTDLYRFLQSRELGEDKEFEPFRNALDDVFKEFTSLENRDYSLFGSFFREGDYLLCHDDLVGTRAYAVAFYLKDFESANLTLYNEDCLTEAKRIQPRANRLIIFKVGQKSFHEVAICKEKGRSAISGWFNISGQPEMESLKLQKYYLPEAIKEYSLPLEIAPAGEFQSLVFDDMRCDVVSKEEIGPLIARRCTRLHLAEYYVPVFENYKVIHAEHLCVGEDGYILCNDIINDKTERIVDIFVFDKGALFEKDFIKYVNPAGEIEFAIDAFPGSMVFGRRNGRSIYIARDAKPVIFSHFILLEIEN